jgi:hypothetical protein
VNAPVGLYRARLGLVVATVASFVALVSWFPLGELLRQRGELAALTSQVASIDHRNATLSGDVASLRTDASVETIAHQEFGLVKPGQLSFVVLPAAGSTTGAPALDPTPIPRTDVVAEPPATAPETASARSGPGFWGRFISRLEFWHRSG